MALTCQFKRILVAAITVAVALAYAPSAAAQATTGVVTGTVKDQQGGAIPGATIVLVSETRGTTFDSFTRETGDFVVANIPGDTYTVRVEMDGFKTSERKGVTVSPGERAAVGNITIEVGALSETVTVTGEAPMIQAQTGDRSFVVATESVEALPVAGRNYAAFAALTPGVVGTANANTGEVSRLARLDGARTNYLLDGVATVDTGGNQQGLTLNPDAIAEVRVISSSYQAEYGRTSGIQIVGVTKSGSNQFRGSIFDIERRTAWNENLWQNKLNGNPRPANDQRDWGFTIGGPVGKPGGSNKLFFFYSQQMSPRSTGGTVTRYRLPTALERQGDFSQSRDQNGNLYNRIRDWTTGLPCTATDTRGCFQAGGVLGRIPADRLYGLGLAVLNRWPMPNASGVNYNFEAVSPDNPYTIYQHVIRADYQASQKLRFSGKYAGKDQTVYTYPGTIPGFDDAVTIWPNDHLPSVTVDYVINSSMVFEGTWGMTQGNERAGRGIQINDTTNKYAVGLADFPTLYPETVVPPDSWQAKVLAATNTPFYRNGRLALPPQFTWGSRINPAPSNTLYPGFLCWQKTNDVALSLTKVWKAHTFKFGLQTQDSYKVQNVGTQTRGVLPPEGRVNFGNDTNNPLDSGFGFANAALGIFSSFEQQNGLYEGTLVYRNRDFYLQDNWKVSPKLSLDYGMRFTHHGPQYDINQQASNFFPDRWSLANAPALYQPGCAVNVYPCPAASRVAVNPLTGGSLGAGSVRAIGTIVPGSGNLLNGIVQQGKGIAKENYVEPALVYGPRLGAAYDLKGDQSIVVRAGVGYFFDRVQGDSVFGQSGNPPTGWQSSMYYSTLQSIAGGAQALQSPPAMMIYYYDAKIGSSLAWNGGVQMVLPWSTSLDVSYVGSHNFNSVAFGAISIPTNELPIDMNAPDAGTAYLPQYQDPTLRSTVPGAAAYTTDLLRPYRGIGAVNTTWPRFWTQYDSMQVALNRRFRNNWQAGLSWTTSFRYSGNTLSPQYLVHNADGSVSDASFQKDNDKLLSNVGLRRHIIRTSASWAVPEISGGSTGLSKTLALIFNDWQLSGVLAMGHLPSYDATYTYSANGSNVNLTGSPNYRARVRVVGDTGSGCSGDQYQQFNARGFAGPTYYSIGNESGTNLLTGCFEKTMDLSLARNVRLGGTRQLQFRLDAFNVLNGVNFNARQNTIQYNSPTDQTVRNAQYDASGTLNSARLIPANAGAGAATGAMFPRTMQAQVRFYF